MVRILLVDDHAVLRGGIKNLLVSEGVADTVLEAGDFGEAVEAVRSESPDAVILDINLPGRSGLDVLEHVKRLDPGLPVLVLSMHSEEQYGLRAVRAGASGYLNKNCDPEEMLRAVRAIMAGKRYVTPELGDRLLTALAGEDGGLAPHERLSNRELEILCLIGEGAAPGEIAERLSVSKNTVSTYRARILEKTGLRNNAALVRYAIENQLTPS